ncbi:MAG: sigma-70 family RNA polymerase sigma factor [Pseudanabaenaceae cyanobacterium]
MPLPPLPENNHPLVKPLAQKSDRELVELFQHYPEEGKYFVAIFCRYASIVYALAHAATKSPVQADYLFVKTWEAIYHELRQMDIPQVLGEMTLQAWLVNITGVTINRLQLPSVEEIQYSLHQTSPVFWCYLHQALNFLAGDLRLILLLSQTFRWSPMRIAAYLQAEGETFSAEEVMEKLGKAYQQLAENLPDDIRTIYLAM